MIILNKMYTGRYIAQEGKLGHEAINLVRADDQKFYIWLNSMGICCQAGVDGCTVLMVRCINSQLYKVLAKAENCTLCDGASIPRKKDNGSAQGSDRENADGTRESDQTKRYDQQKMFGVRYSGKCPMDDIYDEQDMFATFCSDTVCVPEGDVYLTTNPDRHDPQNGVFFADFKMGETMRAYIKESHIAYAALEEAMEKIPWTVIEEPDLSTIRPPEFHFFKLIRKEKDELAEACKPILS